MSVFSFHSILRDLIYLGIKSNLKIQDSFTSLVHHLCMTRALCGYLSSHDVLFIYDQQHLI